MSSIHECDFWVSNVQFRGNRLSLFAFACGNALLLSGFILNDFWNAINKIYEIRFSSSDIPGLQSSIKMDLWNRGSIIEVQLIHPSEEYFPWDRYAKSDNTSAKPLLRVILSCSLYSRYMNIQSASVPIAPDSRKSDIIGRCRYIVQRLRLTATGDNGELVQFFWPML